jgi:DNA modification methylase
MYGLIYLFLPPSSKERKSVGYATQKPKELISRFVLASTNEGDVVADYYLGSGTTAKVCQELNRNFIGCDLNPKAIEITKSRLDALS